MSKKHLSRAMIVDVSNERINVLTELSTNAIREGNNDRAKRYITLARRIAMKTKVTIPKEFRYCKKCYLPMVMGINCRVRLSNHKVSITCGECGSIKRMPYNREQENDRKGSEKRIKETCN